MLHKINASLNQVCHSVILSAPAFLCLLISLQGINKGLVAERLFETMLQKGMLPDFVLCIGDDRSDEDMFEVISSARTTSSLSPVAEVFACTVGQKPSKAKYYVEDSSEILRMLEGLAAASEQAIMNGHKLHKQAIIEKVN